MSARPHQKTLYIRPGEPSNSRSKWQHRALLRLCRGILCSAKCTLWPSRRFPPTLGRKLGQLQRVIGLILRFPIIRQPLFITSRSTRYSATRRSAEANAWRLSIPLGLHRKEKKPVFVKHGSVVNWLVKMVWNVLRMNPQNTEVSESSVRFCVDELWTQPVSLRRFSSVFTSPSSAGPKQMQDQRITAHDNRYLCTTTYTHTDTTSSAVGSGGARRAGVSSCGTPSWELHGTVGTHTQTHCLDKKKYKFKLIKLEDKHSKTCPKQ